MADLEKQKSNEKGDIDAVEAASSMSVYELVVSLKTSRVGYEKELLQLIQALFR